MIEAVDRSLFTDLIDVEGVLGIDLGITNIATDAESCWLIHETRVEPVRNAAISRKRTDEPKPRSNAFSVATLVMLIQSLPGTFRFSVGCQSMHHTSRRQRGCRARDKPTAFRLGYLTNHAIICRLQ